MNNIPNIPERIKRLLAEEEDQFTFRAADAISRDRFGDLTFEDFLKMGDNFQFKNPSTIEAHRTQFDDMMARRRTLDPQAELDAVRQRRRIQAEAEQRETFYQENRAELMKRAYDRQPWSQCKRELELGAGDEWAFRRAQSETKTTQAMELPDPLELGFETGFYGG